MPLAPRKRSCDASKVFVLYRDRRRVSTGRFDDNRVTSHERRSIAHRHHRRRQYAQGRRADGRRSTAWPQLAMRSSDMLPTRRGHRDRTVAVQRPIRPFRREFRIPFWCGVFNWLGDGQCRLAGCQWHLRRPLTWSVHHRNPSRSYFNAALFYCEIEVVFSTSRLGPTDQ